MATATNIPMSEDEDIQSDPSPGDLSYGSFAAMDFIILNVGINTSKSIIIFLFFSSFNSVKSLQSYIYIYLLLLTQTLFTDL